MLLLSVSVLPLGCYSAAEPVVPTAPVRAAVHAESVAPIERPIQIEARCVFPEPPRQPDQRAIERARSMYYYPSGGHPKPSEVTVSSTIRVAFDPGEHELFGRVVQAARAETGAKQLTEAEVVRMLIRERAEQLQKSDAPRTTRSPRAPAKPTDAREPTGRQDQTKQ